MLHQGLKVKKLNNFLNFNRPNGQGRGGILQTNFFPVGSSLGHLSMKKIFQIGPTDLPLKLDKGRVLRVATTTPIEQKLTYFSNHGDDIQS